MFAPVDLLIALNAVDVPLTLGFFGLLVLSLAVHEWGHAWSAWKLGDDLAYRLGRVTLNPLPHLDPMFSVVLPLMLLLSGSGFLFGAGKPVPFDPRNLKHPARDAMLISSAGPAMNVVMALLLTAILHGYLYIKGIDDAVKELEGTSYLLFMGIKLNILLAIFNMLPVPPLDGHRVLGFFLPAEVRERFYRMQFLGLVVILLIVFGPGYEFLYKYILSPIGSAYSVLMPAKMQLFSYYG